MTLFPQIENFVSQIFKDNASKGYLYHNFEHTLTVIQNINTIADYENISQEDRESVLIAGWFHDVGYFTDCRSHEDLGSNIAAAFLKQFGISSEKIIQICKLIQSTKLGHAPENLLEKIIKDADTAHVGSLDYFEKAETLRNELKTTNDIDLNKLQWAKENLKFLTTKHVFYTAYAKETLDPIKQENIVKLQEQIAQLEIEKQQKKKAKEVLTQKKLDKIDSPERGIETMFRVTLNNHTRLSEIADSKANILLSVNAILISISLSTLIPKLDSPSNSHLIIPTFVMIFFSVITIICAILSTKPKISSGHFTREDVEQKKVNLLFFGNFYKMPLEEYNWAMKEMMKDKDYLYETMIKDLYYLGLVLSRKYKWLTITYIIFTIGIIGSALAFVIAFKLATW